MVNLAVYSLTMKLMFEELIKWDIRSSVSARKISNSVARKPFARKTDNFRFDCLVYNRDEEWWVRCTKRDIVHSKVSWLLQTQSLLH